MSQEEGGSLCSESSQKECGQSEISTNDDEQQIENKPEESSHICGDSERPQDSEAKHDTNAASESQRLESKLGSGDSNDNSKGPDSDQCNVNSDLKSNPEEVGKNELSQKVTQEISEDRIKMDVDSTSSTRDSEVSETDHLAQKESISEERGNEDSDGVQTSMDSQEEEEASQLKKTEEIVLQRNEAKEREVPPEDAEDPSISDQEEVNHKQAETPDQAIENSAEMQHTTSEPSTFTESQPSSSTADKRQDTGSQPSSSMADKQQDTGPQPSSSMADKRQERMRKLHELRLRKNEARKLNHVEVIEESKRNKRPSNWEARKRKVEWEAAEEVARKQAELDGEDYEKMKQLETSALELERREKKKMRKKNPDQGFSDFSQAQQRQYERLTKQMEPDMVAYEKTKEEMGEKFYPGVNTIIHGHKPSEAAIDRMVQDLDKQVEKRAKFSRRRGINEDADVDYINDRNMRFNKKAARFYDQYTLETKQNLERGTAV